MARADIYTGLSIDEWARIDAINPCAFNQVQNPLNAPHNACDDIWLQNGWSGGADRILGREDVARAIAAAEELIAYRCGFWPYPVYFNAEETPWPMPKRGFQINYPTLQTRWGYVITPGIPAQATIELCAPIVYTDADGDGVLDTATVTVTAAAMAAVGANILEVNLYPPTTYFLDACGEHTPEWRIRPFKICADAITGDVTITLNRCQLVLPHLWLNDDPLSLDDDANFLTCLDVMRDYTDTGTQAQIVWKSAGGCCTTQGQACVDACQTACLIVDDSRVGQLRTVPASFSAGVWTNAAYTNCGPPSLARLWYRAGLSSMTNVLKEAIARLANVLLPEAPCGCNQTRLRWEKDREVQDINTIDASLAFSAFGTSARGAIFAWAVVKQLQPLGGAASVTR
jgi:hypothetical protein